MTAQWTALVLSAVAAAAPAVAPADTALACWVRTTQKRLTGKLTFRAEAVVVGSEPVPWKDVVYLSGTGRIVSSISTCVVRFKNGDAWRAEILGLAGGKIELLTAVLGRRQVQMKDVWALEFAPGLAPLARPKAGTLYRTAGEPLPGTLLWISEKELAIDSPLGAMKLSRKGLARYVFSPRPAARPGGKDDVTLADGTLLRGRLRGADGRIELDHPTLGRFAVKPELLRSVVRRPASVVHLAEVRPASVKLFPLVSRKATRPRPRFVDSDGRGGLKEMHVQPKSVIRYKLPARPAVLTGLVVAAPRTRGRVKVRVSAGGKVVWERELGPGDKPAALSAALPAGGELAVEIDFVAPIRFPCGAVLVDPHLVLAAGGRK